MLQKCGFVLEIGFVQNIVSFLRSTFGNRQITIEQVIILLPTFILKGGFTKRDNCK